MILFDKVLPYPIAETDYSNSSVWDMEKVEFKREKFHLIKSGSGKGKTTLLSIIYGIRTDFSGNVIYDNENISLFSFSKRSYFKREKLSYLFQGLRLFEDLTGFENIEIKNKLMSFKIAKEIFAMAEKLDIEKHLKRKVKFLSFGQRQRVALIRALCQPFEFLMLDEPFSHLDTDNQRIACDLIEDECRKQGAGLLLTTLGNGYYLKYDTVFEI